MSNETELDQFKRFNNEKAEALERCHKTIGRLVESLNDIIQSDNRGELHRDPLDTDEVFNKAKSLFDEIHSAPPEIDLNKITL